MNDSTFSPKRAGAGKAMPTPTPYTDIKLPRYSMRVLAVASALALLSAASLAQAQTPAPSESAMVKLIRGLIQSGALKKDVGEALLSQAQTEAMTAQQAQRVAAAAPAAAVAGKGMHLEPGDVRVPYISDTVRDQIRDEVKGQVMAQAKTEGWAAPNAMPEWTQRIHIDGDMRFRNESHFYNTGNSNLLTDFNAINAGSGFDVNNQGSNPINNPPLLNTNQNRTNQLRIRARLGLTADISDSTTAGIRLATGNDNNPVSTTQTLGGGDTKKNLWLDQAWLGYRFNENLKVVAGRFGNPFMSTDTLFSNDLNFDGVAAQFNKRLTNKDVSVFGTFGVLPLEYTSDNSPATSTDKTSSQNKWLLALQVGADWKVNETNRLRGAAAYYDFRNITGRVSDSCALYSNPTGGCDTDWSRPAFMQKGNTLMLIRDIALNPADPQNTPQPEYVGLASKFQLLDLNGRWDTKIMGGQYGLRVEGEYVRNMAYNMNDMIARSNGGIANNFGPVKSDNTFDVSSGPNAFMLQGTLGKVDMIDKGDWNVLLGYKYIEPDALPDAYNDSTFNLGGTNARGYYIGGSYAIDKKTWINGRWLSSRQIYGPPLSIDVLQVELNARF